MSNFNDEFKQIQSATVNKYITEPGPCIVTIKEVQTSESKEGYIGKPFFNFLIINERGESHNLTFYRTTKTDSDAAMKFKLSRMKEFFENCGINMDGKLSGPQILESLKGKKVQIFFRKAEKVMYDKQNNKKPYVGEILEYNFSKKIGEKMEGNVSYMHRKIDDKELTRFNHELSEWTRTFGGGTTTPVAQTHVISKEIPMVDQETVFQQSLEDLGGGGLGE
jgi:hypothetical protein